MSPLFVDGGHKPLGEMLHATLKQVLQACTGQGTWVLTPNIMWHHVSKGCHEHAMHI
jgi:hypothetical protein